MEKSSKVFLFIDIVFCVVLIVIGTHLIWAPPPEPTPLTSGIILDELAEAEYAGDVCVGALEQFIGTNIAEMLDKGYRVAGVFAGADGVAYVRLHHPTLGDRERLFVAWACPDAEDFLVGGSND